MGITPRTLQNWRRYGIQDHRKGSARHIPHKLSETEKLEFYGVLTSPRFADLSVEQVVAILATEKNYIASESTGYRILRAAQALHHRRESKKPSTTKKHIPLVVTEPNKVWSWDITWLATEVRGHFSYAYTIIDVFDRSIVGWCIEQEESDDFAKRLFARVTRTLQVSPKIVHADNGNSMRGATLASFLDSLHISRSHSRPRVSNDNAYIESWFKTLKYTVGYPGRFHSLEQARQWFADFVDGYNTTHMHSALGYVTPAQRRSGEAEEIYATRNAEMLAAWGRNPLRWRKGQIKTWGSKVVKFGYRPLKEAA